MAVDIDVVLHRIGEFGPYQRRIYFLLCLPAIFVAMSNLAFVFIGATPKHYRCLVPACDKNTTDLHYNETFIDFAIPHNESTGSFARCSRYKHEGAAGACTAQAFTNETEDCLDGKVFDNSQYLNSIVTEFDLTCHGAWEASMAQSIYFSGVLVGAFIFGFIADVLGRMVTLMLGLLLMAISGIIIALITNLTVFNVVRFINAMMSTAVFQTSFVLGMEFVGPRYRVMCGIIGEYFFALGEVLLGLVALWLRDWRMVQLVVSAPAACFMFYKWFIPESPRWLQAKGKADKAFKILEKVACKNGVNMTAEEMQILARKDEEDDTDVSNQPTIIDVLKNRVLCVRMFSMFFIWIVTTLVYYGLSLNASDLSTSDAPNAPYLDFILLALIEVPGYSLAWAGMSWWGRRGSLALSLLLAGVCCAAAGFAKESAVVSVLIPALLGKCFITCSFGIIYVFTTEMFPTNVRGTVIGLCSTSARIGAILAPFSSDLALIYGPLPMLVFGGLSLVAGLLNLVMPETLGTDLPDTVHQAVLLVSTREPARDRGQYEAIEGDGGEGEGGRMARSYGASEDTQALLQDDSDTALA